jgi:YHS domain-containing protein
MCSSLVSINKLSSQDTNESVFDFQMPLLIVSSNVCRPMSLTTNATESTIEDHHKQILQYFLHDGAYNEQELIDLLHALRDRYDLKIKAQDELRTFTNVYLPLLNKHINEYGIEIKQVTSEEHENVTYFVCTQNFKAQFVKLDGSYTEKEAACFEKLLELIVTSEDK